MKPALLALLVVFGIVAVVAACDAPTTEGSGVKNGPRANGDDDDDDDVAADDDDSASTSQAAECAKLPAADDDAKCDTCLKAKCCAELECVFGDCASKDDTQTLAKRLTDCIEAKCKSDCRSITDLLDGGSFEDPFGDI